MDTMRRRRTTTIKALYAMLERFNGGCGQNPYTIPEFVQGLQALADFLGDVPNYLDALAVYRQRYGWHVRSDRAVSTLRDLVADAENELRAEHPSAHAVWVRETAAKIAAKRLAEMKRPARSQSKAQP